MRVLLFCLERARVWWAALQRWVSPLHNPFVAQALRVDARRGLGVRLAFWFAVWFIALWSFAVALETSLGHEVEVPLVGAETAIGLSWLWALWVARFRLSSSLQKEWLKQRLVPILLSRLSPDEVAALSGAPAVLLGLFVSALSLPAWALGLGLGFLTPLDAWGYALLLLVTCVGFPTWSTTTWEARLNARRIPVKTRQTVSFGWWEARRDARRAPQKPSTSLQLTTRQPPNPLAASALKRQTSPGAALFSSLHAVVVALYLVAPRPLFSSFETWVSLWPPEITMLFGHAYAWPLLLARLLVYPLPFFAASLPLWIALAPFWVSGLRAAHAVLGAALEARRDSGAKRAARVAAIWRPLRGWWAPLLAGFALPVAYRDFWLAKWRESTVMFPSKWGVLADVTLAWWHIVVAMGTFTLALWLLRRARSGQSWPELRAQFWRLARVAGAGVLGAGVLGPLLCGHNPFPAPFAVFMLQMSLVAGTWLLLQTALARLAHQNSVRDNSVRDNSVRDNSVRDNSVRDNSVHQNSVRGTTNKPVAGSKALIWLILLWTYAVPGLLAGATFALSWGSSFINPLSWPYCLISPMTMWFAPRFQTSLTSPLFYGAALCHLTLAGGLWARCHTLRAPVQKIAVAPARKKKTRRQQKAQRRFMEQRAGVQPETRPTFVNLRSYLLRLARNRPYLRQLALNFQPGTQSDVAAPEPTLAQQQTLAQARQSTVAALTLALEARQGVALASGSLHTANKSFTGSGESLIGEESFPGVTESSAQAASLGNAGAMDADAGDNTLETAALRTATRIPLPTPTPEQERFLGRFARFDNALLRLELRRAMGKSEWITSARNGAKAGVVSVVLLSILIPAIVIGFSLLMGMGAGPGSPTFIDMEWTFCACAVLGLWMTSLDIWQKAAAPYDRDRLDGSLDFLFLTPLDTRAIVAGKIVPSVVRGACFFAAFWPSLFTIALLLSLGGDHRLWPLAVLLPLVAWALTARAVAWLHLLSAAKPNSKFVVLAATAGLCAFPLAIAGSLALAVSNAFVVLSPSTWETPTVLLLLLLTALCLLDCLWPCFWSVRVLERERVRH